MHDAQILVDSIYHHFDLPLEPTGSWTTWARTCTNVHMDEGAHKLYLHSATGNALVDKLTVRYQELAADTRTDLVHAVDEQGHHLNTGLSTSHGLHAQYAAGAEACSHVSCTHKLHGEFGKTSIRVKHHCDVGNDKMWGGRGCAETVCTMGHFCGMDGNEGCKCVQLLHHEDPV